MNSNNPASLGWQICEEGYGQSIEWSSGEQPPSTALNLQGPGGLTAMGRVEALVVDSLYSLEIKWEQGKKNYLIAFLIHWEFCVVEFGGIIDKNS